MAALCRAVLIPLAALFAFASCVAVPPQRIIVPGLDAAAEFRDWLDPLYEWRITDSQNGGGEAGLPQWVSYFYSGRLRMIEGTERFAGRYLFVAVNQGGNFNALRLWADNFSPEYDLARLVVHRVERRFVADAALYPDDEYGEYFMRVIRGVSNGEFPGAVKEETFWVRREAVLPGEDGEAGLERFEYLVLASLNMETLQRQVFAVMDGVVTRIPPTREQAAAIALLRQVFFEGF